MIIIMIILIANTLMTKANFFY